LQRRATELRKQARQLYEHSKFPEATKLHEQILAIYQQLYPKDQFPYGHPDLALSLHNLAALLETQADYGGARDYYQRAVTMRQALYPRETHPRGHSALALSLNNLGAVLETQGDYAGARNYLQQAVDMNRALYPRETHPHGHAALALSLSNLGLLLLAQGDYARARNYLQQGLDMDRSAYPKEKHPRGHRAVARTLNNLAVLLQAQGDYAGARVHHEQALAMRQALYPTGHAHLAQSLHNLGTLFRDCGDYARARSYLEQAMAMTQALYPKDQYPLGHPHLAHVLFSLGTLLRDHGDYARARDYFEQALAMCRTLYPKDQYPLGHPHLAHGLGYLGTLLRNHGDYAGARAYFEQALAMFQAIYPKDQYPQGHPYLAGELNRLGGLLQVQADYAGALAYSQKALDMYQGLTEILIHATSEAEALNYLARIPLTRDLFLSASRQLPDRDVACYAQVWRSKGAVLRILRSRQQTFWQLADPKSRDLWERLIQTRRDLARLILSPPRDRALHLTRLQQLTELKEKLERELAERSIPFRRQQELERVTPTDLAQKLPPGSVFIDLLRYVRFEQDPKVPGRKGEKQTLSYVTFVLRPGQPPVRVELGEAGPIDRAVTAWRSDLARRPASAAAATLRRLVWDQLAPHLPADTRTVLVAPDGALTEVPWAALPGDRPGSVLLEDYAFAVVPNGPFLLQRLTAAPESESNPGQLLAVGAVQYDQQLRTLPDPRPEHLVAWRPAERGSRTLWSAERAAGVVAAAGAGAFQVLPFLLLARPSWSYLPGTLREIEAVSQLADPRPVQIRRGTEANTAQLLQDLPQARYALLATHGFFADPEFRSVFLLDESAFRYQGREGRATPGARNPLVLSGLVLAGANQPPAADAEGMSAGDGGILTAEMIASLPLEHLELAVLSACETGLGEVAGGEGVYGLQRAFHLAGAQTTVASLWQVDDEITQELLTRFFENLWHKGMGRLEALRQAQLAVRRGEGNRADPRYWAAWVLSGDPGKLDSSPSTVLAESPDAVAGATWWSGWPWYAAGLGVLGIVVLGLVARRQRRTAR
jgi:CHAT domain-containing protein/Tfp pilus assembly protein PilF